MSGINSPKSKVDKGIPQGSILGPLLFILYINDMNKFSELELVHNADDSTAYDDGSNLETLTNRINSKLQKFDDWLCAKKFSFNVSKSFFAIFSNMKNNYIPIIRIRGFSDNINLVCKKIGCSIGVI